MYNTNDFPVKKEHWYIVALGDYLNITLYPVYFINKTAAKRALNAHIGIRNRAKYSIISANKLKQYTLNYKIKLGRLAKFTKYEYPKIKNTIQKRKTHRTVQRRRLRRMGMLHRVKSKLHIQQGKAPYGTLVKNFQKVAMSPNTDAKAFRLERKPKNFYYVIIKKTRSKIKGVLFKVEVIRFDSKTGIYKELLINIYNKDVILPHLLSEVFSRALNISNECYERFKQTCNSRSISLYKTKQKDLL